MKFFEDFRGSSLCLSLRKLEFLFESVGAMAALVMVIILINLTSAHKFCPPGFWFARAFFFEHLGGAKKTTTAKKMTKKKCKDYESASKQEA